MTDLEDVLRDTLTAHALEAPDAEGLVDSVRARRGHRRKARTLSAVAAVAAATAVAVVVPLALAGDGTARPAHKPSPAPAPAAKDQVVGFHGLEVTVPASWKINAVGCGAEPADNTVIRDLGPTTDCAGGRVSTAPISSVSLSTVYEPLQFSVADEFVNDNGVRIRRGTTRGGPRGTTLVVPAVGVVIRLDAPPPLAGGIIDSLRVTDTDVTGCAMRDHVLNPPTGMHAAASVLVPDDPRSVAICHYEGYWLVAATTATGNDLDTLVAVVHSLPAGFVHARPVDYMASICTQTATGFGELGSGYVLHWHDAAGGTTTEWAHIGYCGPLGITDGVHSRRLTLELARAINQPLHVGFSMPGRLLPGPR